MGGRFLYVSVILLACCSVLANNDVSITLLHDLGDGFVPAGTIIGHLPTKIPHKQKLSIEWNVAEQAMEQLKQLALEDKFYSMRIENMGAPVLEGTAQFSVPARCFEASLQAAHRLDMHTSFGDTMMGFQWRFHRSLDCSVENRKDMPSWPEQSDVSLLLPQLTPEAKVPMMDPKQEEKLQEMYQNVYYGSRGEAPPGQVQGSKPLKKDDKDKTFFEKHWMFILAFAVLAFNALFGKQPPAAGPPR